MNYGNLFDLHPIQSVIQLEHANVKAAALDLVGRFVVTPALGDMLRRVALPQFSKAPQVEGKGIFVVGHYGTGKSHVMSFLSAVAEHGEAVAHARSGLLGASELAPFAGRYLVKRTEIAASKMTLYAIVAHELEALATSHGFHFEFAPQDKIVNAKAELARFLAAVQERHPGKGVLFAVDELLHYLEDRNDQDLVSDLSVLQALGEFSHGHDFVFMAGLQRSLFQHPRFHGLASELSKVRKRYEDFVIDSTGVEQLVETYLFAKTAEQKDQIRELLLRQKDLFESVGADIDRFVRLFPAHPLFLDEFQQVSVVERREILTVLSKEAARLRETALDPQRPELITADRYWQHIASDAGLDANHAVQKVKQNVATLKAKVAEAPMAAGDRAVATRLVEALGVHRLTTPNLSDAIGLTPDALKNRLLPWCDLPMRDGAFLTGRIKVLLDKTREAASGQFLATTPDQAQFYIDPFRIQDFDEEVRAAARTTSRQKVQAYFHELVMRQLELENVQPVQEGRLWNYAVAWRERNVERPGWLFFGVPNQRSTAKPPKDFYLFLLPTPRISATEESEFPDATDELYFLFEGFPTARRELGEGPGSPNLGEAPETFLDHLWLYAAARERALLYDKNKEARTALGKIADRYKDKLQADLGQHIGQWLNVRFRGETRSLTAWLQAAEPGQLKAELSSRFRALASHLLAPHFDDKFPDYPSFAVRVTEAGRPQAAQVALEMLCEVGLGKAGTEQGRAVLRGLGLLQGDVIDPSASSWLDQVKHRLAGLKAGQFLNAGELFEQREDRDFMAGAAIEAEWLHVVLVAGVRAGDLVLVGKENRQYDAGDLQKLYAEARTFQSVTRIRQPVGFPLAEWRRLFEHLGLNFGLLAYDGTREDAAKVLNKDVNERLQALVGLRQRLQGQLPLASAEPIDLAPVDGVRVTLETLQAFTSKARMLNLKLAIAEIDAFGSQLEHVAALQQLADFVRDHSQRLGAVERLLAMLTGRAPAFEDAAAKVRESLRVAYAEPTGFPAEAEAIRSAIEIACAKGAQAYRALHQARRLTKDEDKRKQAVIGSVQWHQLRELTGVRILQAGAYTALQQLAESLKTFKSYADAQLLQSPTTTAPGDPFDPRAEPAVAASDDLRALEVRAEGQLEDWIALLLKNLQDPFCVTSIGALKPDEFRTVDAFRSTCALPEDTDGLRRLVAVLNIVFDGLRTRVVDATEFARSVLHPDMPLQVDEAKARFGAWLAEQIGDEDPGRVRLALKSLAQVALPATVTEAA